jgi:hypothetical protein
MTFNWRSQFATIFGAAMEAAWLSPLLLFFSATLGGSSVVMVGWRLFLLLFLTRSAAFYLAGAELDPGRSRTLLLYLAAASFLLALKIQNYAGYSWLSAGWLQALAGDVIEATPALAEIVLTIACVVYAWWRGLRLAQSGQHPSAFFSQFQIGLFAVVAATFIASRVGYGVSFVPWLFWFFCWGLLAVAVTRLQDIARNRRSEVESYWLPILIAVIALVLLGGGLTALAYAHELIAALRLLLDPLLQVLDLLYQGIILLVTLLILPFAYLLQAIMTWIVSQQRRQDETIIQPQAPFDDLLKQMQRGGVHVPPQFTLVLKVLLVIAIVVIVLKLLQGMLNRMRALEDEGVAEIHESVWSPAELWAALRSLWLRLLNALGIGRQQVVAHVVAPVTAQERAALSVRQVYQRLLAMAAALGHPRPPNRTPYEFLGDLISLLPSSQADLHAITDAYVRARYGVDVTGASDVDLVQQAWQRVKDEGVRVKAEMAR